MRADGKSGPAGPIPVGTYRISTHWNKHKGLTDYRLTPITGNAIKYGRGGAAGPFLIHAGPGIGCIVDPKPNQYGLYSQQLKVIEFMNRVVPKNGTYGNLTVYRCL